MNSTNCETRRTGRVLGDLLLARDDPMGYQIKKWLNQTVTNVDWMMEAMDITQMGMVAATVVVLGFLALKTRR